MPPAWDPPKLLLVIVSGLHVVVGTSSVVGVVIDGGGLAPGLHRLVAAIGYRKGGKGGAKQP